MTYQDHLNKILQLRTDAHNAESLLRAASYAAAMELFEDPNDAGEDEDFILDQLARKIAGGSEA